MSTYVGIRICIYALQNCYGWEGNRSTRPGCVLPDPRCGFRAVSDKVSGFRVQGIILGFEVWRLRHLRYGKL